MAKRKVVSLEDAIRMTKVKVDMDEALITVDRGVVSNGGTQPPIGDYALHHLYDDTKLGYDGKFWRSKCDALILERSELERDLLGKLRALLEKYETQTELLKLLEQKVQESGEQTDSHQEHNGLVLAHEKIKLYEMMTSMTVDKTGENEYTILLQLCLVRMRLYCHRTCAAKRSYWNQPMHRWCSETPSCACSPSQLTKQSRALKPMVETVWQRKAVSTTNIVYYRTKYCPHMFIYRYFSLN
jgi:hypothetical protein